MKRQQWRGGGRGHEGEGGGWVGNRRRGNLGMPLGFLYQSVGRSMERVR